MRKFSKFLLIFVLAVFLTGCNAINEYLPEDNPFSPIATDSAEPVVTLPPDVDISDDSKNTDNSDKTDIQGELKVSFLDVGQADSIFIEMPDNKTMLIDAGNNNDWQTVSDFISAEGYDKIDYLVGTHPHEDHIGGLDKIIDN
ncbi:MAG: MBL fold metallo-hydrolase, partial [Clostridiales bacterium]|nr:MBL fold metallo-hydrolase [Clostridiales bacterium]